MAAWVDACRFNPTAGGLTDWTVSSAVVGYMTPAGAAAVNGRTYKYRAESADITVWEIGEGTYNSSTGVLTRTTILSNSSGTTSKINFAVAPQVAIVALKEDLISIEEDNVFTSTQKNQAQKNIGLPSVLQGWINGLTLSTAGSSTTFAVAAGDATDSTAVDVLALTSSISKTTAGWTVGSGNGALDTGSIANSTWYHAHLIKRVDTQVVDVLVSLSATAPTMPSGYTLSRRIGSMKTNGSGQWTGFVQLGNEFRLVTSVNDANPSVTTTASLITLASVPTGVQVNALLRTGFIGGGSALGILFTSPDEADQATAFSGPATLSTANNTNTGQSSEISVRTNTSAQIRSRSSTTVGAYIWTFGWIDNRGSPANITGVPQQINIPGLLQGYISGLTLSTAGSSTTFSVASGVATDSTNAVMMNLAASISKTTSAWAVGSAAGGLDTGSIAANTWYHAHLIYRADTQVVDVLVSLSASAPTLPTGYAYSRRIGAMKTNGSSQWTKFVQLGNEFLWDVSVAELNAVPGSTAVQTLTLAGVPSGVQVTALLNAGTVAGSLDGRAWIFSPDVNSAAGGSAVTNYNVGTQLTTNLQAWDALNIRTNASAQIKYAVNNTAMTLVIGTQGWIDNRGAATLGGQAAAVAVAQGHVNKFRNGTMDIFQRGTSAITVTTAGAYTADGWIVLPTGASVTAQQAAGRSLTVNSLKVTGAASVTDVIVKQRIESYLAAPLTSQNVTVQAQIFNNTGGTITPTLTVKHAGSADNYTSPVTDVSAVNLQACPNGLWTLVAYTFTASASAALGLEVAFDFGNNFSTTGKSIQITECDIRVTNNVAAGLNGGPPAPELRPIQTELQFCIRYYWAATLYVGPGSAYSTGTAFPSPMRATPTMTGGGAGYATAVLNAQFVQHTQTTPAAQAFTFSAEL